MKKWKIVLLHSILWVSFLCYTYSSQLGFTTDRITLWLNLSITLAKVVAFYSCFLFVFPRYLKLGKIPQLIVGVLLSYLVFAATRSFIEEILYPYFLGFGNYDDGTAVLDYLADNLYYGIPFIILSAAVYATLNSFKQERRNSELKQEADKTELAFLKSQINPHFLYNSLNYLYGLAIPVSDKLAMAIVNLSDLMRYTLSDSKDGKVEISKEVGYIRNYIALFRMRFEPSFYVNFTVKGEESLKRIAALLLIPFVENALKHGVMNNSKHPVEIDLAVEDTVIVFIVENLIGHHQKDLSSGIGLINVQRRLQLIYPDRHSLTIIAVDNTYKIILQISL